MSVEGTTGTGAATGGEGGAAASSASTGGAPQGASPQAGATSATSGGVPAADPAAATGQTPPVYTPNYKFKVMDKEHEFDEWLRPVVKDAETEKKIRELYEKAHGLDYAKPKHQALQEQFNRVQGEHTGITRELQQIGNFVKQGDLGNAFGMLGIPEQAVFKYVYDKLQYDKLPPEQRQRVEQEQQLRARYSEQEQRLQAYEQMLEQQTVQARTFELNTVLEKPEVKEAIAAFDARVGRPGAFREEVVKRGALHWHTTKTDIAAEQAVQEVMQLFGFQGGTPTQAAPQVQQGKAPPVIPNVAGRGASPVKRTIKSLDELRALGNSM